MTRPGPIWLTSVSGARLREIVGALQDLTGVTARDVFGDVDAMKLRSSLTLFSEAGGGPLFRAALDRWFDGVADEAGMRLLLPLRVKRS